MYICISLSLSLSLSLCLFVRTHMYIYHPTRSNRRKIRDCQRFFHYAAGFFVQGDKRAQKWIALSSTKWYYVYTATQCVYIQHKQSTMNNEAGITMNNEAGRALKSTSNQSSEPCEVAHYSQQKCVQGGQDPQHALSFEVIFFAKEPYN